MQDTERAMQDDLQKLEKTLRAKSFWDGKAYFGSILLPIVAGAVVDFAQPDFLTVPNDKAERIASHEQAVDELLTVFQVQQGEDAIIYFKENDNGLPERREQSILGMIAAQQEEMTVIAAEPDLITPVENRLGLFAACLAGIGALLVLMSFRSNALATERLKRNAKLAGDYGDTGSEAARKLEERILGTSRWERMAARLS